MDEEAQFDTCDMQEKQQLVSCVTRERTLSGWRVLSDEGQEFVLCLLESDVAVPDSLRQA